MATKTSGSGYKSYPAALSSTPSISPGNAAWGSYVQLVASTGEADYIVGIALYISGSASNGQTCDVAIATGGAGSETDVTQIRVTVWNSSSGVWTGFVPFGDYIPIASATRLACRASIGDAGPVTIYAALLAIPQSNVVDAGLAETANVTQWAGQSALLDANNLPKVDVEDWKGGVVPAVSVTGTPKVDVADWLGTAVTAATPGLPDTNPKRFGNTLVTGRDIGASVLISPGTGTGQLDVTSGAVKSNLVQILGTALTESPAGRLAAAISALAAGVRNGWR